MHHIYSLRICYIVLLSLKRERLICMTRTIRTSPICVHHVHVVSECLEQTGTLLSATVCGQFHSLSWKSYANRRTESSEYNEFARIIRFWMVRGSAVTDSLKGDEDRSQRMRSFHYCGRQWKSFSELNQ